MNQPYLLHHLIDAAAARLPTKPAVVHRGASVSYAELAQLQDRFAGGVAAHAFPGARVATWLGKSPFAVAAAFGATRAGAVFVPINPVLKAPQVGHILRDCTVEVLVTSSDRLALLDAELDACPSVRQVVLVPGGTAASVAVDAVVRSWEDFAADGAPAAPALTAEDVAAIFYTSGSTGRPKGVVVPHRSLVTGAAAVASYLDQREDDRILAAMPLSFDAGFSQLTTAFSVGATCVLLEYAHPAEVVRTIAAERITGMTGVPPLWSQLVAVAWPAGAAATLRYWATTGGRMPQTVIDRLRAAAPAAAPFLMYGLTEAFRSTYLPPVDIDRKPGSIGRAIPNQEVMVLRPDGTRCAPGETGELVHRGSTVTLGYWNDPEATAERFGWVRHRQSGVVLEERAVFSGDQVRMDEDGYLYFVGRRDEMIKSSGYRISPVEVEEAVYATGLVDECCAYGIDDEALGQVVAVAAVPRPGADCDDAQLLRACRAVLPNYMLPRTIDLIAGPLPRNPNGKIDRRALPDLLAALRMELAA